jgi:hypothetical protein
VGPAANRLTNKWGFDPIGSTTVLSYFEFVTTRNKTLFQIRGGDPDQSSNMGPNAHGLNRNLTTRLTKSKAGNFFHYYRNFDSLRSAATVALPGSPGKQLIPATCSRLAALVKSWGR